MVLSLQNSRGRAKHLRNESLPLMTPSRLLMTVQKGQWHKEHATHRPTQGEQVTDIVKHNNQLKLTV